MKKVVRTLREFTKADVMAIFFALSVVFCFATGCSKEGWLRWLFCILCELSVLICFLLLFLIRRELPLNRAHQA
jgi:hypothetical protein